MTETVLGDLRTEPLRGGTGRGVSYCSLTGMGWISGGASCIGYSDGRRSRTVRGSEGRRDMGTGVALPSGEYGRSATG